MLLEHRRYQEVLREVKALPALGKINSYNNKWMQHIRRVDRSGHPDAVAK